MSYTLRLACGCIVRVVCDTATGMARSRIVEQQAGACRVAGHRAGRALRLWELLPPPGRSRAVDERIEWV